MNEPSALDDGQGWPSVAGAGMAQERHGYSSGLCGLSQCVPVNGYLVRVSSSIRTCDLPRDYLLDLLEKYFMIQSACITSLHHTYDQIRSCSLFKVIIASRLHQTL